MFDPRSHHWGQSSVFSLHKALLELEESTKSDIVYAVTSISADILREVSTSVLARDNRKEWCFLRDQSIAVVLITFFQPHQKKIVYPRAVEHRSSTLSLEHWFQQCLPKRSVVCHRMIY